MKNIITSSILFAATCLATGAASAQTHMTRATIPFSFTAGESTVPAGNYTVRLVNEHTIRLDNAANHVHLSTMTMASDASRDGRSSLIFHRYGSQYFLSDIKSPDAAAAAHLPTTRAEKRAKSEARVAGLADTPPVLVALN